MVLTASLTAQLENLQSENAHLTALTNQQAASDGRDVMKRRLTCLQKQNGSRVMRVQSVARLLGCASQGVQLTGYL